MDQNSSQNESKGMPPAYTEGQPPPAPPVVITTQPAVMYQANVVAVNRLGSKPSPVLCPSCRAEIVTRVELKSSTKTHLFALLLCIIFFPCVCLPYCIDSCRTAEHYCPNCNAYIGNYNN